MTLGPLNVHFANESQAAAMRGDASLHVATLPGQPAAREALFTALAEALALPGYFGRNWDALADCLSDLPPTVLLAPAALWETSPDLAAMLAEIWMSAGEGQHLVFLRRDA